MSSSDRNNIAYGVGNTDDHLIQILELQKANRPQSLSKEEMEKSGFVSIEHDLSLLKDLGTPYSHVIATNKNKVIGYALVMLEKMRSRIPLLIPMFELIDSLDFENTNLKSSQYFVMGQVCVAKDYRGRGVFRGLYDTMSLLMRDHFDFIVTEISTENKRSIEAHRAVGFQTLTEYNCHNENWAVVLLDIRPSE